MAGSFVTLNLSSLDFLLFWMPMSLLIQPMPLQTRALPFDDPNWLFELKYDGFRALAVIEHGVPN